MEAGEDESGGGVVTANRAADDIERLLLDKSAIQLGRMEKGLIASVIQQVIEKERDECAKVADSYPVEQRIPNPAAAAIRARGVLAGPPLDEIYRRNLRCEHNPENGAAVYWKVMDRDDIRRGFGRTLAEALADYDAPKPDEPPNTDDDRDVALREAFDVIQLLQQAVTLEAQAQEAELRIQQGLRASALGSDCLAKIERALAVKP